MKSTLLVCLLALGCKKDPCGMAFDHMRSVIHWDDGVTGTLRDQLVNTRDAEVRAGVLRCRADSWSSAVIRCMDDAQTETAYRACFDQLTPEQREHLDADTAAALANVPGSNGSAR